ncbi:polysaccharide deacetylase family protein [Terrilactibacillus sp. BCM23-1]|uniref:Polysaccharide deacetylase family protein n=1 Tax=Terrilactibacillus tamarindi TaxID=2599694 RepID=A0A6N8CUH1_9BACI|nr:polysaccharide deacetylase family protein [Terrilactibacillus tamarindi]MTT32725.1 polysaccharide deacetylase family protein [Terrilactibacillus tamarindi]
MRFIWVINGTKLRNTIFILIASFFAALVAFIQNQEMSVFSTTEGPRALTSVHTEQPHVALTFDISWGDEQIKPILEILKQKNVKATFFVSGEWAERHPEIIEKIKKDGHEIGSHGMNHTAYTKLDDGEIRKDLTLAESSIYKVSNRRTTLMRPPYGKIDHDVLSIASTLDQQVILWSVNPQDDTNPGYQKIAAYTINHTEKGDIIRLHASDSAKQTYRALPYIIDNIQKKGLSFTTLSDLISDTKVKTKSLN